MAFKVFFSGYNFELNNKKRIDDLIKSAKNPMIITPEAKRSGLCRSLDEYYFFKKIDSINVANTKQAIDHLCRLDRALIILIKKYQKANLYSIYPVSGKSLLR